MIAKCQCQHCGGNVEFEAAEFELIGETSHRRLGQTIDCPHCGKPTQIYMNKAEFIAPKISAVKKIKYGWLYVVVGVALVTPLLIWLASILPFISIAAGCVLGGILILLVLSYIVEILTLLCLCVGLFLIVNGIMDMIAVNSAPEETVFHQIYALLEFVGGALVFCAAMILHLLRSKLNPPTKASPPSQNKKD